jgi:hypothetical protein
MRMRNRTGWIVLMGSALLVGSGCGADKGATSAEKLALTPQQAAAIKRQDEAIQNEEGGPAKVTRPGSRPR